MYMENYVWRYDSGYVVDPNTGEVIDVIYEYSPYYGNNEPSLTIGTIDYESKLMEKASRIQKALAEKGFVDTHGTYVNYKLGLTNKSVKSLRRVDLREELPLNDVEFSKEVKRWKSKLDRNLNGVIIGSKTKIAIACILAARSLGKDLSVSKIAKFYDVDEKYLRKILSKITRKLIPYMLL